MLTQEYATAYYCQAMVVNIRLMKQLAAELPVFATADWHVKTANYMQRLQDALIQLEQYCQTMYAEASDTEAKDVFRNFIFDMNTLLALIHTLCHLLERTIPRHDTAQITVDAMKTYTYDLREIMEHFLLVLRSDE